MSKWDYVICALMYPFFVLYLYLEDLWGYMRDWIGKFFGFDKEIEALDTLLAYKESELYKLREELDFYKGKIFVDHGIINKVDTSTPIRTDFQPARGVKSWALLRRSLEARSPVKVVNADTVKSELTALEKEKENAG